MIMNYVQSSPVLLRMVMIETNREEKYTFEEVATCSLLWIFLLHDWFSHSRWTWYGVDASLAKTVLHVLWLADRDARFTKYRYVPCFKFLNPHYPWSQQCRLRINIARAECDESWALRSRSWKVGGWAQAKNSNSRSDWQPYHEILRNRREFAEISQTVCTL